MEEILFIIGAPSGFYMNIGSEKMYPDIITKGFRDCKESCNGGEIVVRYLRMRARRNGS